MVQALVVYGTRYGATEDTSMFIANILRQEGFQVRLVNAKEDKISSIEDYGLVIVGSGIRMRKWTREPEKFLEKFQRELSEKKLALFVCCGAAHPLTEGEEKDREIQDAHRKYLEEKAAKYNLQPIALGLFGGVYDFNKMGWIFRRTMSSVKPQLEEAGFKETESGRYDTRDLEMIRSWVEKLAVTVSLQ
jgi:menaquinone-dependent protoporphyrinogen oxidase